VKPLAVASPEFPVPGLWVALRLAVDAGLAAAAVLDVEGRPLRVAGELDDYELQALATLVTGRIRERDLLTRMLDGELMTSSLNDRNVHIGIVANCVFVVVVLGVDPQASQAALDGLRLDVERMINDARADVTGAHSPEQNPPGGSSSGPAELPVVELGITVPRRGRN
jgi:hypothetical protein